MGVGIAQRDRRLVRHRLERHYVRVVELVWVTALHLEDAEQCLSREDRNSKLRSDISSVAQVLVVWVGAHITCVVRSPRPGDVTDDTLAHADPYSALR